MQRKKKRNSLRIRQYHYTVKSPFVQAEKGEWRAIRRKMYRNDKNTRGIPAGNLCKREVALTAKSAFDTTAVNKKPNKENVYGRRGGMGREKQKFTGMNIPDGKLAFLSGKIEETMKKFRQI